MGSEDMRAGENPIPTAMASWNPDGAKVRFEMGGDVGGTPTFLGLEAAGGDFCSDFPPSQTSRDFVGLRTADSLMSTRFFTHHGAQMLFAKFQGVFAFNKDLAAFDALVG